MPKVYKQRPNARRFKEPGDAARELHVHFGDWSSGQAKYALQLTFALMAANWALHGTTTAILDNRWATWSMVAAIAYLAVFHGLMSWLVRLSRRQHRYADADKRRWASEFAANAGAQSDWPYTPWMERVGTFMYWAHLVGPLLCGALLLCSVYNFESTKGLAPGGSDATGSGCCTSIKADVAAIRRVVEGASRLAGRETTSALEDAAVSTPGSATVHFPTIALWVAFGMVVSGVAVVFRSTKVGLRAAGASMATVGALTLTAGGFTLIKEVKVDSIFSIKVDKLLELVRQQVIEMGGAGPEQVAAIERFKLGEAGELDRDVPDQIDVTKSKEVARAAQRWVDGRKLGRDGVLLVIGSTDRLPLGGAKERQFEANVGLARARGEAVKRGIIAAVRNQWAGLEPKPEQVIVLVSGPGQTPRDGDTSASSKRSGYPEDRRVDVWAFWAPRAEAVGKPK